MELFKKKTSTDKAIDLLTNALHDDEISSFIVLVKKENRTIMSINGDLFSQAISLISAQEKDSFKRIELLADVMKKAVKESDADKSRNDTPGDGEI